MRRLGRAIARGERGSARLGQCLGRLRLIGARRALRLGGGIDAGFGRRGFGLGRIRRLGRLAPAAEDHPRLGDADLRGEHAIALGLPRLSPERGGARLLIGDHLVEPFEIGLGRAQFLLGVLAADVQARDPRRFLQHRAALGRLGGDHRADPPLADQCGRMRAGRRIGEQQGDILGAHVAPVDAIGGAGATLDAADDFLLLAVKFGEDRDFGEIARRPRRGAGEDHVFHASAAHRLGRVLAHRPAQRLEQIGFAAAVGADHAGQPRLDAQIGRVDEALEAR